MAGRYYYGPQVDPGHAAFGAAIAAGMREGRARVDQNEIEEEERRRFEAEQAAVMRARAIQEAMAGVISSAAAHEVVPVAGAPGIVLAPPPVVAGPSPSVAAAMRPDEGLVGMATTTPTGPARTVAAPMERRVRENVMVAEGPGGPVYIDPSRSMAAIQAALQREQAVADEQRTYETNQARMANMVGRLTEQGVASGATRDVSHQAALRAIYDLDLPDPYTPIPDEEWADIEKRLGLETNAYNRRERTSPTQTRLADNDARRLAADNAFGIAQRMHLAGDDPATIRAAIEDAGYGEDVVGGPGVLDGIIDRAISGGYTMEDAIRSVRAELLLDPESDEAKMALTDPVGFDALVQQTARRRYENAHRGNPGRPQPRVPGDVGGFGGPNPFAAIIRATQDDLDRQPALPAPPADTAARDTAPAAPTAPAESTPEQDEVATTMLLRGSAAYRSLAMTNPDTLVATLVQQGYDEEAVRRAVNQVRALSTTPFGSTLNAWMSAAERNRAN